jgi:hypothetical protein
LFWEDVLAQIFNDLPIKEVKEEIECGVVVTGAKAALFLCDLIKTKGKGTRTVRGLYNKVKLHENYELTLRKRYGR